jgi:hypothetical protein
MHHGNGLNRDSFRPGFGAAARRRRTGVAGLAAGARLVKAILFSWVAMSQSLQLSRCDKRRGIRVIYPKCAAYPHTGAFVLLYLRAVTGKLKRQSLWRPS